MRLLLVEDDPLLGDGVRTGLDQAGFAVDWVRDGAAADAALRGGAFAAVVLDIGLPKLSGLELLQALRARGDPTPVLILTARDAVPDRIRGLEVGADDYLVKPFDLGELAARLRALIRRSAGRGTREIRHGDLVLDPEGLRVTRAGEAVDVSPREFAVLHELLQNAGRVRSRQQLEQTLYGWTGEVESNAVEVHIHHLRRKLGAGLIRNIRGVGYIVPKDDAGA